MINDPFILLSYINTKLRDNYANLDSLCDDLDLDKEEIKDKLLEIGYFYNEELNAFTLLKNLSSPIFLKHNKYNKKWSKSH